MSTTPLPMYVAQGRHETVSLSIVPSSDKSDPRPTDWIDTDDMRLSYHAPTSADSSFLVRLDHPASGIATFFDMKHIATGQSRAAAFDLVLFWGKDVEAAKELLVIAGAASNAMPSSRSFDGTTISLPMSASGPNAPPTALRQALWQRPALPTAIAAIEQQNPGFTLSEIALTPGPRSSQRESEEVKDHTAYDEPSVTFTFSRPDTA